MDILTLGWPETSESVLQEKSPTGTAQLFPKPGPQRNGSRTEPLPFLLLVTSTRNLSVTSVLRQQRVLRERGSWALRSPTVWLWRLHSLSRGLPMYKTGDDKRLSETSVGRSQWIILVIVNTKLAIVIIIVVLVSLSPPKSAGPLLTEEDSE